MKILESALAKVLRPIRFERALESEFRVHFEQQGKVLRGQVWMALLVGMAVVLVVHSLLLDLPTDVEPMAALAIAAVLVPAFMRWLSSAWGPLQAHSAQLYIGAALIDIVCMMWLRVVCQREGYDVVPLMVPVGLLMSLIVVQIRFLLLLPAMLVGLAIIVGVELWALEVDSNRLFAVTAAMALALVGLSPAYEMERWARLGWLRKRRLNELACTDALTGLANRRQFDASLKQAIRSAAREGKSVSLMLLDVDHFKPYNDHYGHPAGDACLQAVGAYLKASMHRPHDVAARVGGEEFAVIWFDASPGDALRLAEDLRRGISALGLVPAPGRGKAVTASAGFTQLMAPQPEEAAADLMVQMLHQADAALYQAKGGGRDRLEVSAAASADAPRADRRYQIDPNENLDSSLLNLPPRWTGFGEPQEAAFRATFEQQGRASRRLILAGLFAVIVFILMFMQSLLQVPEGAIWVGQIMLLFWLMPATVVAFIGNSWSRLFRWSALLYITATGIIVTTQMVTRVVQLSQGYDVVPLIMPMSVMLSLCVVQIRLPLLAPSVLLAMVGLLAAELWVFDLTTHRLLEVFTVALMTLVTLRFSWLVERYARISWQREQRLNELACTDALTGLANRRHFDDRLHQTLRSAAREGKGAALLILDIDYFKSYNDHYGHPAGDECLRSVGRYLRSSMRRPNDFAARLGGEEFAAVWFDAHPDEAERLAEQLRRGIAGLGIVPAPGHGNTVTASGGLVKVMAPQPQGDAEQFAIDLMQRADDALYEAKRLGRDQLKVFGAASTKPLL